MRRKDREVLDFDEIIGILDKCKVMHLAMISEGKPYSVPVNFGYMAFNEDGKKRVEVYFHGAKEGKKVSALKENPQVCFSAVSFSQTESSDKSTEPCSWTCFYESVTGSGKAVFLENAAERAKAMDALMLHNGYRLPPGVKTIAYNMMMFAKTSVVKIEIEMLTGKRHLKK